MQHVTFTKTPANFDRYIKQSTGLLQNIGYYYTQSSTDMQNKLIEVIFPEKLIFTGNWYNKTKEAFNVIWIML